MCKFASSLVSSSLYIRVIFSLLGLFTLFLAAALMQAMKNDAQP
jgi:hypothetical protein